MSNIENTNLIFFLTSIGHWGNDQIYKYTLNSVRNQIDINKFKNRIVSLKLFNDNQEKCKEILSDFGDFNHQFVWSNPDPKINSNSSYGAGHPYYLLTNYLHDIAAAYLKLEQEGNYGKYTYLVEDDSPVILAQNNLEFYINEGIKKLEEEPNLFSVHIMREGNLKNSPNYLKEQSKYELEDNNLYVKDRFNNYNFQNQIMRTDLMIKVAHKIKENYNQLFQVHTESAVRAAINMVDSEYKICYFNPRMVHSNHIGIQNWKEMVESYNLSI